MDTKSKKFSNNTVLRAVVFAVCALSTAAAILLFGIAASEQSIVYDYAWFINDRLSSEIGAHESGLTAVSQMTSDVWRSWMPYLVLCTAAAAISFVWLAFTTGAKKYKESDEMVQSSAAQLSSTEAQSDSKKALPDTWINPRKSYVLDRMWTEVQLLMLGIAATVCLLILSEGWCGCLEHYPLRLVFSELRDIAYNSSSSAEELMQAVEHLNISERILKLDDSVFGMFVDYESYRFEVGLMAAGILTCTATALWFFLSIVRLLKCKCFFKNAITVQLFTYGCIGVCNIVMNIINGGSLMRKVILIMLGIVLLSCTVIGAPIAAVLILIFAPIWVKRFEAIQYGVDEVKSGNLEYKIRINGENAKEYVGEDDEGAGNRGTRLGRIKGLLNRKQTYGRADELTRLACGINEISQASNEAVKNELKNQRMKTELISNVSHDLKTPLTSLVTYIDLLKKEGLDSPNAQEYLEILDSKTERLGKLTEDLFEAAKASSGAMPVNITNVDALALVNQVMGEMNDRIEASGLEFIVNRASWKSAQPVNFENMPNIYGNRRENSEMAERVERAKYIASADGQLLYRTIDNLLSNILKYALPGSRVYIDISEPMGKSMKRSDSDSGSDYEKRQRSNGLVLMEFKNISAQALNIEPDELMERFKRGDESRATEGSGLGLAIAKDLIKLMGGWLELTIDGDFFKASVYLNKSSEHTKLHPEQEI